MLLFISLLHLAKDVCFFKIYLRSLFITAAIGGVTGQLLDQINRAMDQVYANFSAFRENSYLLEVLVPIQILIMCHLGSILYLTSQKGK